MDMRSASYPKKICAHRQCSTYFDRSSDSDIFEFSGNFEFSISPEKVIPRQN